MAIKNLGRVVGADGKSAYEIWLEKGNTGTEEDFLDSLKCTTDATEDFSIPSYWEDAVNEAIDTVNTFQDEGGKDCFTFAFFADTHNHPKWKAPNPGYTGALSAKVMDACSIPFAIGAGDLGRNDGHILTKEEMIESIETALNSFKPIGTNRMLSIIGNHDGSYGMNEAYTDYHYTYQMTATELYNLIYRPQAQDTRRVFGGDGSFFYVDYPTGKTRFIMLNSVWVKDEVDENGVAINRRMRTFGYGQDQLSWLAEKALSFDEEGWAVVISAHTPPASAYESTIKVYRDHAVLHGILNAFLNKTTYSGTYGTQGKWSYVSINCDFTNKHTGEIIGIFCGHVHKDTIVKDELPYPIITITSDSNMSSADPETRVYGTDNEHAIDFITVNRKTKLVNLTRLGIGSNRVYSYDAEAPTQYTITNNLTSCSTDNSNTSIGENEKYIATLTASTNYTLDSVVVTMGGEDITATAYANGVVTIEAVTGDIIITASAIANEMKVTNYANPSSEEWHIDKKLTGTNKISDIAYPGCHVTNWIDCKDGDVIRVYGLNLVGNNNGYCGGHISAGFDGNERDIGDAAMCKSYLDQFPVDENGVTSFTVFTLIKSFSPYVTKVRFSGDLTVDSVNDVIITINEEIF